MQPLVHRTWWSDVSREACRWTNCFQSFSGSSWVIQLNSPVRFVVRYDWIVIPRRRIRCSNSTIRSRRFGSWWRITCLTIANPNAGCRVMRSKPLRNQKRRILRSQELHSSAMLVRSLPPEQRAQFQAEAARLLRKISRLQADAGGCFAVVEERGKPRRKKMQMRMCRSRAMHCEARF